LDAPPLWIIYAGAGRGTLYLKGIPLVWECVEESVVAWSVKDGAIGARAAAPVAQRIIMLNDDSARRVCSVKQDEVGYALGIYQAVIEAIDGALKLGKQGTDLDRSVTKYTDHKTRETAVQQPSPPKAATNKTALPIRYSTMTCPYIHGCGVQM